MKKIGEKILKLSFGLILCLSLNFFEALPLAFAKTATSVKVEALVDRNTMGIEDTFELRVVASYSDSANVSEPQADHLNGFEVLNSGRSSSTSSQLVQGPNGMQFETHRLTEFVYQIAPKKIGKLTIPPFTVMVDGRSYSTKPIQIEVLKESVAPPPKEDLMDDPMDEANQLFNQLLKRRNHMINPGFKGAPKNPKEALSVLLELDKTEAYEGEQVVANWYIYTRGNILSLDRLKFPDLKGFWKEILEEVPALNFTQEVINGLPYRKALLASHALFPIKAGTAVIDEFKIRASVALSDNPLSAFGFGKPYTYSRSSERTKIEVRPLPLDGKPQDFSGAVGQFDVKSVIEGGNQFPVAQPFALKVRFEGTGNAKLIELPVLNLPPNLEIYNTKNEAKFFKNGRSYKEFEILLIPRQEGEVTLPSFGVSMFDPQLKKYVSKQTDPIQIKITPALNSSNSIGGAESKRLEGSSEATSNQQGPNLPEVIAAYDSQAQIFSTTGVEFWAFAYGLIALILGWKAKNEFGLLQKQKNLRGLLEKRLKKVMDLVEKGEWRASGVEMTNTIYFILGEVSGQGGANLEIQKLLDLAPPSVRRELGTEFEKFIEIFQVLSFAPEEVVGKLKEKTELKKNFELVRKLLESALKLSESDGQ